SGEHPAERQHVMGAVDRLHSKLVQREEWTHSDTLQNLRETLQSPLFNHILTLQHSIKQLCSQVRIPSASYEFSFSKKGQLIMSAVNPSSSLAPPILSTTSSILTNGSSGRHTELVSLTRPLSGGLGFSVVGLNPAGSSSQGVFVKNIQPGGIAHRDGRLQEQDQILVINGTPLKPGISQLQALSLLQQPGETVELVVARDRICVSELFLCSVLTTNKPFLQDQWGHMEEIQLVNDGSGLGFGIVGGKTTGVVVRTLLPHSVADKDGRLRTGDHILRIGSTPTSGLTSDQVVKVLQGCGSHVTMLIARDPQGQRSTGPPPPPPPDSAPVYSLTPKPPDDKAFIRLQKLLLNLVLTCHNPPPPSLSLSNCPSKQLNGVSLHGMTNQEVLEVMKQTGQTVVLTVVRKKTRVLERSLDKGEGGRGGGRGQTNLLTLPHVYLAFLLPVHTLRLGVELDSFDGHHYISSVVPGGPIDKHGVLRPEDELLEVNDVQLYGKSRREVVSFLKEVPPPFTLVCCRHPASDPGPGPESEPESEPEPHEDNDDDGELALWSPEVQVLELQKERDKGLGFSILDYQDPLDPGRCVMVIRSLVPGGSAERHGGLLPGDQLVSVNQTRLDMLLLAQAVEVLKSAPPGSVHLGIRKPLVVSPDLPGFSDSDLHHAEEEEEEQELILDGGQPRYAASSVISDLPTVEEGREMAVDDEEEVEEVKERKGSLPRKPHLPEREDGEGEETPAFSHWGPPRRVEMWAEEDQSLGLSIVGGRHVIKRLRNGEELKGIFIKQVLPNSPAARTQCLKTGDKILEVSGVDLRAASHEEAVNAIKSAPSPVVFIVQSLSATPRVRAGRSCRGLKNHDQSCGD
uniref:PATJ crumbs cell polarity complex component n=1 Tax=Echeneis naucrates TaxID=173247 RepID=A0A665VKD1_ECHNA